MLPSKAITFSQVGRTLPGEPFFPPRRICLGHDIRRLGRDASPYHFGNPMRKPYRANQIRISFKKGSELYPFSNRPFQVELERRLQGTHNPRKSSKTPYLLGFSRPETSGNIAECSRWRSSFSLAFINSSSACFRSVISRRAPSIWACPPLTAASRRALIET